MMLSVGLVRHPCLGTLADIARRDDERYSQVQSRDHHVKYGRS